MNKYSREIFFGISFLAVSCTIQSTFANSAFSSESPWMFGDWNGQRIALQQKGYDFSQFKDAFDRYLSKSDAKSATPLQSNSSKALDGVKETTNHSTVANRKDLNPTSNQSCSSVADKQPSLSKPQKLTETQIADWGWR